MMAMRRIATKASKTKTAVSGLVSSSLSPVKKSRKSARVSAVRQSASPVLRQDSPPGSPPGVQAVPSSDLSLPASQLTSEISVMSLNPALMSNPPSSADNSALAENLPASAEISANSAASAVNSAASVDFCELTSFGWKTDCCSTTYTYVGEKAPHLSGQPTRAQVTKDASVLMSSTTPFKP
jgi:hypothetical protein